MENNLVKQAQLAVLDTVLDKEDQVSLASEILGYSEIPPTIEKFITDPFYLGDICENLYPFWVNKLKELYPNQISNAYPIVVFRGGIGTGKSTVSRIMALYLLCRIFHLKNPYDTFKFVPGKNIKFSFFTFTAGLADTDFIGPINNWIELSPYFKEQKSLGKFDLVELVSDGTRGNSNIGSDVIFYVLSEINFVNQDKADEKLNQALNRFDSRFDRIKNFFGQIILDSSSRGDSSVVDAFVNKNSDKNIYIVNTNKWIVREHLNYYGNNGWFKVYKGDSFHSPFIISDTRPFTSDMDKDRIIEVPNEFEKNFKNDIIMALQDIAGISTNTFDKFFQDSEKLIQCFDLPNYVGEDVLKFDFYDKDDKLIYRLDRAIKEIPDDKVIFIRYDIGVTSDYTGLAICYLNEWKTYDKDEKIRNPEIMVPVAVAISRYNDQETPIYHLFEFILDLKKRFEIGAVTTDQFGSRQLIQDCIREQINKAYFISVDKTDDSYKTTKNLIYNGLLHLPKNERLKKELSELRRVGVKKVDHPYPDGSKDIADAVAGCIQSVYDNKDKASMISNKYRVSITADYIAERTRSHTDIFQEMIQIYD